MFEPRRSKRRGFTLIELLVVVAIIGVLTSIVLASLTGAREQGRDAKRLADVKQLQLALALYYDANSGYPSSTDFSGGVLVNNGYIAAMPVDPLNGQSGTYTYTYSALASAYNPSSNPNPSACSASPCGGYVLRAVLENGSNPALSDDVDATINSVNCGDPNYCVIP